MQNQGGGTMINIEKLSAMAKLNLYEEEKEKAVEYAEFLAADFEKFKDVNTDGVKPYINAIELTNVLREDKVVKKIDRETLLANAPDQSRGYFRVPKTLE